MRRFGAALSTEIDLDKAVEECVRGAQSTLAGETPDVALIFVSHEHHAGFRDLARKIKKLTGAAHVLGCAGETIVGGNREVEAGPALSLWLGRLPDAGLNSFRLSAESEDGKSFTIRGMPKLFGGSEEELRNRHCCVLVFGDPFSFPAHEWLEVLNREIPGLPVYGGMASGGHGPGQNRMFFDEEMVQDGAVGIAIEGVPVGCVVSQGCRPLGPAMVVTKASENVLEELAGKPALERLQEVFQDGDERDRELLQRALHVGQVVDETISQPGRGDFLVRNVMAIDEESGAISLTDVVPRGRTVRFHVRDSVSADEDLRELLSERDVPGEAALLFSCNGRGTRLFEESDHDAGCIRDTSGGIPIAGFFAQGEIGPVGGRNFLHGFTASIVLFEDG